MMGGKRQTWGRCLTEDGSTNLNQAYFIDKKTPPHPALAHLLSFLLNSLMPMES